MLFDLRGRGRRRTVKAIYLALALLLGGSLVGFGIGSNSSGGGLIDALLGNGNGAATGSGDKVRDTQIANAVKVTRARPRDPVAWAKLAQLRFQSAAAGQNLQSGPGRTALVLAGQAWQRYLSLNPKVVDKDLALLMTRAYGQTGLNQPAEAVRAMRIVTAETKPPSSNLYQQLALLAYQAKQTATGDLAAAKAVQLAAPGTRKQLRAALKQLKTSAAAGAAQGQSSGQPTG